MVRKKLLDKIGGINEDLEMIAAEDYNTWLKISQLTEKFLFLPKVLGFYQLHEKAVSAQKDMSIPDAKSVMEFLHVLDTKQRSLLSANLLYQKGLFAFQINDYELARRRFLLSIRKINYVQKIKAIVLVLVATIAIFFRGST